MLWLLLRFCFHTCPGSYRCPSFVTNNSWIQKISSIIIDHTSEHLTDNLRVPGQSHLDSHNDQRTIMMRLIANSLLFTCLVTTTVSAWTASSSSFLGASSSAHRALPRPSTSTQLCMKTIAVFGASGLTASECVYQALKNGDSVVGLTRYVQ
jgi:hypothetical protein